MLLSEVVMTMMARPIQNSEKKPWKSCQVEFGSKWDRREVYWILGKLPFLRSARTCFRAEEVALTEGGASTGRGVLGALVQGEFVWVLRCVSRRTDGTHLETAELTVSSRVSL